MYVHINGKIMLFSIIKKQKQKKNILSSLGHSDRWAANFRRQITTILQYRMY